MQDFEPSNDDTQLDRLVDGELSPDEYRQLLLRLEHEPGGWRRCAVAFLEAQALGQELNSLRQKEFVPTTKPAAPPRPSSRSPLYWLALAASFVVALGLGMGLRSLWSPHLPRENSLANQGEITTGQETQIPAAMQPPALAQRESPGDDGSRVTVNKQPLGNVTLVVDGAEGNNNRVDVPVFGRDQVAEDWPSQQHSAVSDEVRDLLEKSGHQVRRMQRLMPFQLESGQQVVVPVEEVEIVRVPQLPY